MVPDFLTALEKGGDGTEIPGVLGRIDGTIKGDETFQEIDDLDSLPFPYENQDFRDLDHRIMYYESSRGCPFHCQYCLSGTTPRPLPLRAFSLTGTTGLRRRRRVPGEIRRPDL